MSRRGNPKKRRAWRLRAITNAVANALTGGGVCPGTRFVSPLRGEVWIATERNGFRGWKCVSAKDGRESSTTENFILNHLI